jgi:hypothetical protein
MGADSSPSGSHSLRIMETNKRPAKDLDFRIDHPTGPEGYLFTKSGPSSDSELKLLNHPDPEILQEEEAETEYSRVGK